MEGARVTSVILNRCIRTRLLVFKNLAKPCVCVCDAEYYLKISVLMLVSRIGGEFVYGLCDTNAVLQLA